MVELRMLYDTILKEIKENVQSKIDKERTKVQEALRILGDTTELKYFNIEIEEPDQREIDREMQRKASLYLRPYLLPDYKSKDIKSFEDFKEYYSKGLEQIKFYENKVVIKTDLLQGNLFEDKIVRHYNYNALRSYLKYLNKIFGYNVNVDSLNNIGELRELNVVYDIDSKHSYMVTSNSLEVYSK